MQAFSLFAGLFLVVRCQAQNQDRYALPSVPQEPPKPTVPRGLESYFRLNNPGADWVKALGLSGFIPERNFDFEANEEENEEPQNQINLLRKLSGGVAPSLPQLPPEVQLPAALRNLPGLEGLAIDPVESSNSKDAQISNNPASASAGFLGSNNASEAAVRRAAQLAAVLSAARNRKTPSSTNIRRANTDNHGSSISGIPNIYPTLPKAPVPQSRRAPALPRVPKLPSAPVVPNGGFGPVAPKLPLGGLPPQLLSQVQPAAGTGLVRSSPSTAQSSPFGQRTGLGARGPAPQPPPPPNPAAGLASLIPRTVPAGQEGAAHLFTQLAQLLGIGTGGAVGGVPGGPAAGGLDLSSLNSLLGLGQRNQGVLSSVLYSALTDGAVREAQKEEDTSSTSALGSLANAANVRKNVALIQQLITQPQSPLCNPKPVPVRTFDIDAFMGTWYQTLYSPPLSQGPCSMVAYKKLADVARGGPGTVFDTFEYTTEGTPFGQPRISSGYAIIRGPGQLIYRTTNSPTDVNVYVLKTGPVNQKGQYDYVVLGVNCNYPLHVFARDPVMYKQRYEAEVNSFLEQRGITNGFSRLLNIVAPVDSSLCHFPPTLFNIQG